MTIQAEALREALRAIERFYYVEGKDASWRAAQMRATASAILALIDKEKDQYKEKDQCKEKDHSLIL